MIQQSELILNNDGTIFHLHLKPENLADQVILVGDQARVKTVADFFDTIDFSAQNREFHTVTGRYNNQRFSVISTGIGTDNIDIVLNELDALVNIDLEKREIKKEKRSLKIVRIGTSGALQEDIPVNAYVVSQKSIGFDGMLKFYAHSESFCDLPFEKAFKQFTGWKDTLPDAYVVDASKRLADRFNGAEFRKGVTISAPGFYGPQGRVLRLPLAMPQLNKLIEQFRFEDWKITNFEMESSAIYGLSKMLGHQALTICLIIANRFTGQANENYRPEMKKLIKMVLDCLTK
ncbi:nucleoside phosphorylase [Mariniphaga sediminis]|uniref:nucleoside phosphorylase n=1 Tax=Mariniphaga sediminis TaxID=1628158 RepID=UPI0035671101